MEDLKPGDVVALKSGGRDMVVVATSPDDQGGLRVEVMWQSEFERSPMSRIIPAVALVRKEKKP